MHRRSFLNSFASLVVTPLISTEVQGATKSSGLKITDVEIWRIEGQEERMKERITGQNILGAIQIYPEHRPEVFKENMTPSTETAMFTNRAYYIKILTNGGLEGFYGTINRNQVDVVLGRLRRSLIGMDPLAIDTIWDKMYRRNSHGYVGDYMEGLSSVDICLWDLKGKFCDMPVYKLLGGSRTVIDCYASTLRWSLEFDLVRKRAAQLKEEGFKAQKWFFAYGPSYGDWGLEQNVGLVRTLRETLGEYYPIMFDCFLGWDLNYSMKMFKAVEQYNPAWIEEAVLTEQIESLARLRQMFTIPIATGEHSYGRWAINEFIRAGAIDIIQADPEWCGGISETVKICNIASAHDLIVSPHNQRVIALAHVVASQPPNTCPMMEYQNNLQPALRYFEKNPLVPKNGQIELPDRPGFGIELDESKIENMEKIS
ncbi:enolase C-terminal domain-like protein [Candidatus Latescibacterota bacterium]